MGKRAFFLGAVALSCILAVGCGDKKGQDASAGAGSERAIAEVAEPAVWEGAYRCKRGDPECTTVDCYSESGDPECKVADHAYFAGTVFNTVATADVNVRNHPSTKGENLFQLRKGTKVQIIGVSKDGWAYIATKEPVPRRGWAYGQYIEYTEGQKLTSISELKVEKFVVVRDDPAFADLTLSYKESDGTEKNVALRARKSDDIYTFVFDIYSENSHYGIIPGVYSWNSSKNQLKHAAFLVREQNDTSSQSIPLLLGDLKYYAVAGPLPEMAFYLNLGVPAVYSLFRSSDNRKLADNLHELKIERGNTITMTICPSDAEVAKIYGNKSEMDAAIAEYINEYRGSEEDDNDSRVISAKCEVNLETGERTIVGAQVLDH